jgi:acetylornithine/succinyldiaminopimelate/putrescine aminotransferase
MSGGDTPPDAAALRRAVMADFGRFVNPQKVRVLAAAGLDLVETERSGAWVRDVDGRRFLDCFTSAGSFNVGRRNPRIVQAAKRALDELDHGNFLLASRQKADLARRLAEIAPAGLTCTTFGTGGGEAVDFALKLARGATRRQKIVYCDKGYHGHTGFALSAAGRPAYREPFEPLMPGFERVPFGDLPTAQAAVDEQTAAIIVEPVQGEGGIRVAPPGYLQGLRQACDEAGALLVLDEIQTGFGRTGRWFASEHFDVVPDIMTVAKSLGGSVVSLSATVYTEELREFLIPNPFVHLSTFGGSDLACAIGLEVIDTIEDEGLVGNAEIMGERLMGGLRELAAAHGDVVAEVRGLGLMTGVQYRDDSMGPRMSWHLARHGVLAVYTGNEPSVMRIMPSLVVTEADIDFLVDAFGLALADLLAGVGPEETVPARQRRRPQPAAPTA